MGWVCLGARLCGTPGHCKMQYSAVLPDLQDRQFLPAAVACSLLPVCLACLAVVCSQNAYSSYSVGLLGYTQAHYFAAVGGVCSSIACLYHIPFLLQAVHYSPRAVWGVSSVISAPMQVCCGLAALLYHCAPFEPMYERTLFECAGVLSPGCGPCKRGHTVCWMLTWW